MKCDDSLYGRDRQSLGLSDEQVPARNSVPGWPRLRVLVAALVIATLAPSARSAEGVNIDFGTAYGTPTATYGAAPAQVGSWNLAGLGSTALIDLSGGASGMSLSVVADSDFGGTSTNSSDDDGLLLRDNFYSLSGATWSVDISGLALSEYLVFLYAPSNSVTPTGDMIVGGVPVASLFGDWNATLIEGTSWAQVEIVVTDGTLAISGTAPGSTGLAGLQLVPVPVFTVYCTAGVSASGCSASLVGTGTPSAPAASGFELVATSVEGAKDALFFFGVNGRQANSWGNSSSYQCVKPPVGRAGILMGGGSPGACDGSFTQDLNARW